MSTTRTSVIIRPRCSRKNGGPDPDAIWHSRSDGSTDEAGGGVWRSVHGKRYF